MANKHGHKHYSRLHIHGLCSLAFALLTVTSVANGMGEFTESLPKSHHLNLLAKPHKMPRGLSRIALHEQEEEPIAQHLKISRVDSDAPRSVARFVYDSSDLDLVESDSGSVRNRQQRAAVAPKSTLDIIQEYGRVMRKRRFGNFKPSLRLGVASSDSTTDQNYGYYYNDMYNTGDSINSHKYRRSVSDSVQDEVHLPVLEYPFTPGDFRIM